MTGFEYGNTRLRAMKSRLINNEQMEALMHSENINRFINQLSLTHYHHAVEVAVAVSRGMQSVPEIIQRNLAETLGKMCSFYSGREAQQVELLLWRYDLENMKAVLRGVSQRLSGADILSALMPVGVIPSGVFRQLASAEDIRVLLDRVTTLRLPFSQPLLRLRTQKQAASSAQMELALERWHFSRLWEALKHLEMSESSLAETFTRQADFFNLMTCLRFVHEPEEHQRLLMVNDLTELLVESQGLSADFLHRIASQNRIQDAVQLLAETPYAASVQAGYQHYQHNGLISEFEKQLRLHYLSYMARQIPRDPLGIGVPLGYTALKENEVHNLRLIALYVHLGFQAERIREMLEVLQ